MKFYEYREDVKHKTDKFPVAYYRVDSSHPRYEMMHHWHPEFEIIYVERGSLTLTLDKSNVQLNSGEFCIIPSGTLHSGKPYECVYECIVFDLNALVVGCGMYKGEIKNIISGKCTFPTVYRYSNGEPETHMAKLFYALRLKDSGFEIFAVSEIFGLFYSLIKLKLLTANEKANNQAKKLKPFADAVALIEENYSRKITLSELAESSGMSIKYFSEYFKNISGKSPFDYLNEYRAERAAEMLINTDKNVTDICMECGFNDLSYFTKVFGKYQSSSPAKYRKTHK